MKEKVRTTFRPERELEVTAQEALDLKRQGLLVDQEPEEKPEARQRPARKGEQA